MAADRASAYWLGLIALLVFGTRCFWLTEPMWFDEGSSLAIINAPNFVGALRSYDHPPLYFMILKAVSTLSDAALTLRIPSVVFGTAAVMVMALWAEERAPRAGVLFGLLCAGQPLLVRFSQEIRDYALFNCLVAVAIYAAGRLEGESRGERRWWWILGASLCLAVATHAIGVFLPVAIGLPLLLTRSKIRSAPVPLLAALVVAPLVTYGLIFRVFMTASTKKAAEWWMPPPDLAVLRWNGEVIFDPHGLAATLGSILSTSSGVAGGLLAGLAGLLLVAALTGPRTRASMVGVTAVAFLLQLYVVSWLYLPVLWYRTALPALLPLAAFVAVQVAGTRRGVRRVAVGAVIVLAALQVGHWITKHPGRPWENWRDLGRQISSDWHPDSRIVIGDEVLREVLRYEADVPDRAAYAILSVTSAPSVERVLSAMPPNAVAHVVFRAANQAEQESFVGMAKELEGLIGGRFALARHRYGGLFLLTATRTTSTSQAGPRRVDGALR